MHALAEPLNSTLHESLKNRNEYTPREELIGEEALNKSWSWIGKRIKSPSTLYKITLAGEVLGNTAPGHDSPVGHGG